ncbi:hypothetical protein Tco_0062016, partial [Tanacetum coccineum]
RKYRNEKDALAIEKAKIEEDLLRTKSQLEHRESVGVECGLRPEGTSYS